MTEKRWKVINSEVQGKLHIMHGIPCQDKTFTYVDNCIQIIALADGIGSAKNSEHGAQAVTKAVCKIISKDFDKYYLSILNDDNIAKKDIVQLLHKELECLSIKFNCDFSSLASTMLFVAIKDNRCLCGHIGDGIIGIMENGKMQLLSTPTNFGASNITIATTSNNVQNYFNIFNYKISENTGSFVLMSDGAADVLYSYREKIFATWITDMIKLSISLEEHSANNQLQNALTNVIKEMTDDDCSIAIISRPTKHFRGYVDFSYEDKCGFFELNPNVPNAIKHLKKYDTIMSKLKRPISLHNLSKKLHIRKNILKKELAYMVKVEMVETCKSYATLYYTLFN